MDRGAGSVKRKLDSACAPRARQPHPLARPCPGAGAPRSGL